METERNQGKRKAGHGGNHAYSHIDSNRDRFTDIKREIPSIGGFELLYFGVIMNSLKEDKIAYRNNY